MEDRIIGCLFCVCMQDGLANLNEITLAAYMTDCLSDGVQPFASDLLTWSRLL